MSYDAEYHREYYKKNKDKLKEYQREYALKNNYECQKKYYLKNKDKMCKYSKKYQQDNKDKIYGHQRKYQLKSKYGLSLDEYDTMLLEQNSCCAICGTDIPGGNGRFHVDHCHDSDKIRGLLCVRCNMGLGYFKDSTVVLARAIEYLASYDEQEEQESEDEEQEEQRQVQ